MKEHKHIVLKHGTASVSNDVSQKTIEALNTLSIKAYYKGKFDQLVTPNKGGLIPAIEICKTSCPLAFERNARLYKCHIDESGETLNVSSKMNEVSFVIDLHSGDLDVFRQYGDDQYPTLDQTNNQWRIINKYIEFGIEFDYNNPVKS